MSKMSELTLTPRVEALPPPRAPSTGYKCRDCLRTLHREECMQSTDWKCACGYLLRVLKGL
jgi:DNA-directed RNA polymerase subunit RPC12/RpoP